MRTPEKQHIKLVTELQFNHSLCNLVRDTEALEKELFKMSILILHANLKIWIHFSGGPLARKVPEHSWCCPNQFGNTSDICSQWAHLLKVWSRYRLCSDRRASLRLQHVDHQSRVPHKYGWWRWLIKIILCWLYTSVGWLLDSSNHQLSSSINHQYDVLGARCIRN